MMKAQAGDIFSAIVHIPFGGVGIRTSAGLIQEMVYLPRHFREKDAIDALADKAARQILRYIDRPDYRFSLPLAEVGSIFQRKVWAAISSIPRGETRTYGQIARYIQSAPRAVGQACGANWFPLIVPCHRVTASGRLGGFSHHDAADGFPLSVKRWLLAHEGVGGY
ncbi:MAG: methylated-DNA--[protein]-cysteine S-methyltransferase [Herbaspirillum sp.]